MLVNLAVFWLQVVIITFMMAFVHTGHLLFGRLHSAFKSFGDTFLLVSSFFRLEGVNHYQGPAVEEYSVLVLFYFALFLIGFYICMRGTVSKVFVLFLFVFLYKFLMSVGRQASLRCFSLLGGINHGNRRLVRQTYQSAGRFSPVEEQFFQIKGSNHTSKSSNATKTGIVDTLYSYKVFPTL